jgi:glycosyltransferase involved in cell wall biosynthesis
MGSANIIKDGVNGLVVQPYDVDGLAAAISRLANSPDLRIRLALQAAKDAKNFTFEKVGKERANILSGLIPSRSH